MKKILFTFILLASFTLLYSTVEAQCSICQKTVMQSGTKPAKGFNTGILFLMSVPFATIGVIGYKWWKASK
ncbi:MAG: hypothetical protein ABIW47_18515 [Ginsengibacter sp.]|jgi:hypothetical protein